MKKLIGLTAAVVVVGSLTGAELAGSATTKIAICHKTASKTKPYVRLVLANSSAHNRHADDIIPAPARCPQTLLTARSGGVPISVTMRGVNEQPSPGDPDGSGTATIRLRQGQGRVCFELSARDVQLPATGAHIHRGSASTSGDVVVAFTNPNAQGTSSGCATATRTLVRDILTNRTDYYVNVHTSDFPAGAIRGQLALPTTAKVIVTDLAGTAERPGPGDSDGAGTAAFLLLTDTGRLCYTITVRNITLPSTGAHIHRGDRNTAGNVVIPLQQPLISGSSSGCLTPDAALLREIADNPANFYANVHTGDFIAGAIRGQLG